MALPTKLFYFTLFLMQSVNLIFIARTSDPNKIKEALNGIGIAHLYVNCVILSVVTGIISGFGTLGAKAFSSKNYYLMGLYYHRAQIIGFISTIILLIINYFYSLKILSLMGVEDEVIVYVDEYLKVMMFYVLFEVQFGLNMLYMNIIKKPFVNFLIFITTLLLHPLWCYVFIIYFDMGIKGAGISLIFSHMLNSLEGVTYIYAFKPLPESIFFYNRHSFKGWWDYLRVALPMTLISCFEWWGFELLSIVALWIGKTDYTVHILLANLSFIIWTLTGGIGLTASLMISKALCEQRVEIVKKYIKIIYSFSILCIIFIDTFVLVKRNYILKIFVEHSEILKKGDDVIPIICIVSIFGNTQYVFSNVLRGLGKELLASVMSFIYNYFLVSFLAYLLGIWLGWGVYGIWLGIMISHILSSSTYSFLLIFYLDYEKIQLDAFKKLQEDNKLLTSFQIIGDKKQMKDG